MQQEGNDEEEHEHSKGEFREETKEGAVKPACLCNCGFDPTPTGVRTSGYGKSEPEFKLRIVAGVGAREPKKVVSTAKEGSVAPDDDAPLVGGSLLGGRAKKSWRSIVAQKAGLWVVVVVVEERVLLE